ncbi:MAG: hypothetical protein ACKVOR_07145 [Flavobacteriales bacterium]
MKYLPRENLVFKTRLKEDEVAQRISDITEPDRIFRSALFGQVGVKHYEGFVRHNTFEIKRIIRYKNSFKPVIRGTIKKEWDGTHITITMRMHAFVRAFLAVWCGIVGLTSLVLLVPLIGTRNVSVFTALIPMGVLLFVHALSLLAFKAESNKSKKFLQELLEVEVLE